jgi:hypothetical protein
MRIWIMAIPLYFITIISCNEGVDKKTTNKFKDGVYCSHIFYTNPKTAFSNTYDLNIEIKDNKIIKIYFKNGFIDESHFSPPDLSNERPVITTFEGNIFNINGISETVCNNEEPELEPEKSMPQVVNYRINSEFVVYILEGTETIEHYSEIGSNTTIILPENNAGVIPPELKFPDDKKRLISVSTLPYKKWKLEKVENTRSIPDNELDEFSRLRIELKMKMFENEINNQYDNIKTTKSINQMYYKIFYTYKEAEDYIKEISKNHYKEVLRSIDNKN